MSAGSARSADPAGPPSAPLPERAAAPREDARSGPESAARSGVATVLRPARLDDVDAVARMINGYAAQGLMLPRSPAELYRSFRELLVVAEPDGSVVACGALRVYGPHLAEVVGLAVRADRRGEGYGAGTVNGLLREAASLEIEAVFAMTLEVAFFRRLGFRPVPRERLPEKVAADCRSCARREGCRETAVLRRTGRGRRGSATPAPTGRRSRRKLRVLTS